MVISEFNLEIYNLKKITLMLFAISMSALMIATAYACPPGKVSGGGQIVIGSEASFGFNAMWFSRDAGPKGEFQYVDHKTGMKVHAHKLDFLEVRDTYLGNKPSDLMTARFYGPCRVKGSTDVAIPDGDNYIVEVKLKDRGEPGTGGELFENDFFRIGIWEESITERTYENSLYWEDAKDASPINEILHGNIQTHKPPK